MQDIRKFGGLDLLQFFAALFQLLERLHDSFCHPPVRLLRSADDRELLTRRNALVTILIVQADAQETRG